MLRGITQTVDRLQGKRLLVRQELDASIAQSSPNAGVKADGFLRSLLTNPPTAVNDRCFKEHLK